MGHMKKKLYKKPNQKYYVKGDAKVERKIIVSDILVKAVALAFYPFYLAVTGTGKLVKRIKNKFKNESTLDNVAYTSQNKAEESSAFGARFKEKVSEGLTSVKNAFTQKVAPFVKKNKWAVSGVTAFAVIAATSGYVFMKSEDTPVVASESEVKTHQIGAIEAVATPQNEDSGLARAQGYSAAKMPELKVMSAASARVVAVEVNGKSIASFKSEEDANKMLDALKEKFRPSEEQENRELVDIYFAEDVQVKEKYVDIMDFNGYDTVEDALTYVSNGSRERKTHVVEKGENFWTIASYYGIGVSDLEAANPDVKPERLQIGMEISLVVAKPMISVCTVEKASFKEQIAFEVVYEDNGNLFKGEQRTKVEGSYGERVVTAELTKQNGKELARKTLNEEVKSQPKTKVVYKGTKNPPPRVGTGVLARPVAGGPITSPFGPRGRGRHLGIDIGVRSGTPVMAADGGTVIFAGWGDSYGYHVIIDHGGNMTTLYAHNSKLAVKRGDKVHKGQTVSYSGNTGNSYGAHLHFEVRINGVHQNPANYVRF